MAKKKVINLVEDYIKENGRVTFTEVADSLEKFIGSIGKQIRALEKLGRVKVNRVREGRSWVNYAEHVGGLTLSEQDGLVDEPIIPKVKPIEPTIPVSTESEDTKEEGSTKPQPPLVLKTEPPTPVTVLEKPVEKKKPRKITRPEKPPSPPIESSGWQINLDAIEKMDIIDLMFLFKNVNGGVSFPRRKGTTKAKLIDALIAKLLEIKNK